MLDIRTDQLKACDAYLLSRFADELADDLFRCIPSIVAGLTWSKTSRRCLEALHQGRRHGLADRADLYGFVLLSFLVGLDFLQHEEIQRVLVESNIADGRRALVVITAMLQVLKPRSDT
jgi:hypothetical protein